MTESERLASLAHFRFESGWNSPCPMFPVSFLPKFFFSKQYVLDVFLIIKVVYIKEIWSM